VHVLRTARQPGLDRAPRSRPVCVRHSARRVSHPAGPSEAGP
jgi:hypothetical protein